MFVRPLRLARASIVRVGRERVTELNLRTISSSNRLIKRLLAASMVATPGALVCDERCRVAFDNRGNERVVVRDRRIELTESAKEDERQLLFDVSSVGAGEASATGEFSGFASDESCSELVDRGSGLGFNGGVIRRLSHGKHPAKSFEASTTSVPQRTPGGLQLQETKKAKES